MKKTKLLAEVNGAKYAVYVDGNERLYIKISDQFIYVFNPELIENNIRIYRR